jgi:type VI secretion system secreted protein Hcp
MAADNFLFFTKAATGGLLSEKATQPEGETTDEWFSKPKFKYTAALEILSFNFGIAQAETSGSATGGASAGKAKFEEFTVEKLVDQSSCPLYNACTAGAHFPDVMLAIRKAGGSPLLYIQYHFRQVYVTAINWSGGGGEEGFKETIKFKFGAMGIQYIQQTAKGGEGKKMVGMWNTTTNFTDLNVTGLDAPEPAGFLDQAVQA